MSYNHDVRGGTTPNPLALITIKADLERALLMLQQVDGNAIAAMYIRERYIEGRLPNEIAKEHRVTPGQVGDMTREGRKAIARILGWRES